MKSMRIVLTLLTLLFVAIVSCTKINEDLPETLVGEQYAARCTVTVIITGDEHLDSLRMNSTITEGGEIVVVKGAAPQFEFFPTAHYRVASISVNGEDQGDAAQFNFSALQTNATIEVTIEAIEFSITFADGYNVNGDVHINDAPLSSNVVVAQEGSSSLFKLVPLANYEVSALMVNDIDVMANLTANNEFSIDNITEDKTVAVNFTAIASSEYKIEFIRGHGDNGTIQMNGSPLASSVITVEEGASPQFKFIPDTNYEIGAVTVNDGEFKSQLTNENELKFDNITEDKTIAVDFALTGTPEYQIKIETVGDGSVRFGGKTIASRDTTITVLRLSQPQFFFDAIAGNHLDSLILNNLALEKTPNFTFPEVTAGHTLRVVFAANEVGKFTVSPSATLGGIITPNSVAEITAGETPTYNCITNDHYQFDSLEVVNIDINETVIIKDASTLESGAYTFAALDANYTIKAFFSPILHSIITRVDGGNGTLLNVTGGVSTELRITDTITVKDGDSLEISMIPSSAEYQIESITVNGSALAVITPTYTFKNIMANDSIVVTFNKKSVDSTTVTTAVVGSGSIDPAGQHTVAKGSSKTFTMRPDPYYKLSKILINDDTEVVPTTNDGDSVYTYVLTDIQNDTKITPHFTTNYHVIKTSVTTGTGGSFTDGDSVMVLTGDSKTLSIVADTVNSYYLVSLVITKDGTNQVIDGLTAAKYELPLANIRGKVTVTATFNKYYTITTSIATASGSGSLSDTGTIYVPITKGYNVSFMADTLNNYVIDSVVVHDIRMNFRETIDTLLFNDVKRNHTLVLYCGIKKHNITLNYYKGHSAGGSFTPNINSGIDTTVEHGDWFTVHVQPNVALRYIYAGVYFDGVWNDGFDRTKFVTPEITSDVTIDVRFARQHQVKVRNETSVGGVVTVEGKSISQSITMFTAGFDTLAGTISPDVGYRIHKIEAVVTGSNGGTFSGADLNTSAGIELSADSLTYKIVNPVDTTTLSVWFTPDGYIAQAAATAFKEILSETQFNDMFPNRYGLGRGKYIGQVVPDNPTLLAGDGDYDYFTYESLLKAIDSMAKISVDIYRLEGLGYMERVVRSETGRGTVEFVTGDEYATYKSTKTESLASTVNYADFCNSGDLATRETELAAFLANISHETSGSGVDQEKNWGLYWREEYSWQNDGFGAKYDNMPGTIYAPVTGQSYHGRGPFMLTNNGNYGMISQYLYGDKRVLLDNASILCPTKPDDATAAFMSAIWFWMTPQFTKPSSHEVMTDKWTPSATDLTKNRGDSKFGMTINIINGALECNKGEGESRMLSRISYFRRYMAVVGISTESDCDCNNMERY